MMDNLKELNEKVNLFVDFVVKTACESTTSGNYFVSVENACKASGMGYDDFLEYRDLIVGELHAREEVLDFNYLEDSLEFDVNCGLIYCPGYQWCDGDEEIFGCTFEEWLERPAKPVTQLAVDESVAQKNDEPNVYFTVRDMFGDDIEGVRYPSFEAALKALRGYCAQRREDADGAMLGIVCKTDAKTHKCVLVQNVVNKYNECVLKPMYSNIAWETLDVPEIELAALKGKQLQYPFDEATQLRIDYLEKRLGVYDRDVDTSGDLYVGKWRVHIVAPGAHYGLNNCLTNEESRSLIEFWDMSQDSTKFPDGQFTGGRYYVETLLEDKWGPGPKAHMEHGLCLDGDNRDVWSVSGAEMTKVYEWLKSRELLAGEHYFEYHCDMACCSDAPVYDGFDVYLSRKLLELSIVRDVKNIECFGSIGDGDFGYSFSFRTQAPFEAIEKAFAKAFESYPHTLKHEEKVVEREKEALDKVIKDCASQVKNEPVAKGKDKELEK